MFKKIFSSLFWKIEPKEEQPRKRVIKKKIFDWWTESYKIVDLDHELSLMEDDSSWFIEIDKYGNIIDLPYDECKKILNNLEEYK